MYDEVKARSEAFDTIEVYGGPDWQNVPRDFHLALNRTLTIGLT